MGNGGFFLLTLTDSMICGHSVLSNSSLMTTARSEYAPVEGSNVRPKLDEEWHGDGEEQASKARKSSGAGVGRILSDN